MLCLALAAFHDVSLGGEVNRILHQAAHLALAYLIVAVHAPYHLAHVLAMLALHPCHHLARGGAFGAHKPVHLAAQVALHPLLVAGVHTDKEVVEDYWKGKNA